jgi:predicted metal-dependent peptidase
MGAVPTTLRAARQSGHLDHSRLAAARLWAVHRFPYFAAALFALRPVSSPDLGTFACDRYWRLYVDPETLDEWTVPQAGAVLVHEVLHLLRDHAGRADTMRLVPHLARAWNVACDAEINDDLVDAGLPLPGHPVLPSDFKAQPGRLAEEYFQLLKRRRRGPDCGSGVDGWARPGDEPATSETVDGVGPAQARLIRRQIAAEIICARAEAPGRVSDGLVRWAEGLLHPSVDWRRQLGSLIRGAAAQVSGRVDHSYSKRSRRAAAMPQVILPGLARPVPAIAVVIDTSASMEHRHLGRCLAELDGIITSLGLRSRRVDILAVDTTVRARGRVARAADVDLRGGGGTDMGAGIAAAAGLRPKPQLVVVLSDGHTPWPAAPPGVRVVAALLTADHEDDPPPPPPAWARTVTIPAS